MVQAALNKALKTTMNEHKTKKASGKKKHWWNFNFSALSDELKYWYLKYRNSDWTDHEAENKQKNTTSADHSDQEIMNHIETIRKEIAEKKTFIKVTEEDAEKILLKLNIGKSVGLSEISNEMYKYFTSKMAKAAVTRIINDIITSGKIPDSLKSEI